MKNQTLVAGIALILSSTAYGQHEVGNGGDMLVNEFTGTMNNIVNTVANLRNTNCASADALSQILNEVKVKGAMNVFVDGVEQDARSYTENGIKKTEISRVRLIQNVDAVRYANLVLHEYYVHLGLETTNEMIRSKACIDSLSAANIDLAKLIYRDNKLKSTIQLLDSGTFALECPKADQGSYRIYVNQGPADERKCFHFEERSASGQVVASISCHGFNLAGPVNLIQFRKSFKTNYDLSTGITRISFNERILTYSNTFGVDRYMHMAISTTDQINWSLTWNYQDKPHKRGVIDPFSNAACHLITM